MTTLCFCIAMFSVAVFLLLADISYWMSTLDSHRNLKPITGEEYKRLMDRVRENYQAKLSRNGETSLPIREDFNDQDRMMQSLRACAHAAGYHISLPEDAADRQRYLNQLFNVPDMIATRLRAANENDTRSRRMNAEMSLLEKRLYESNQERSILQKQVYDLQQEINKLRHQQGTNP